MQRRRFGLSALAFAATALAGCGFELKRPPQMQVRRIHLLGFRSLSPMADELRRQLRANPDVQVIDDLARAEVVLESLIDGRERVVAASTAIGQVSELTLRVRFRFIARDPGGKVLIPETELLMSRDLGYSETAAIAKENEIEMLYRAMHSDVATQVLRRLAALPPA
ncbi:MAG: LPS assembly lipoprotein LptE [Burkholderiales bacterium]